jgi:hypothetical protein
MTNELVSYIPLANMRLTSHQVDLFLGSNQVRGLPNYIRGLDCVSSQQPRKNFDFDCTDFLMIAQKELLVLWSVGVISLVSWLVACVVDNCLACAWEVLVKVLPYVRRLLMMVMLDALVKATYSAQLTGFNSGQEVLTWLMIVGVWGLFVCLATLGMFAALTDSYPLLQHFLFSDLKPTVKSRLYFSFVVLHRMNFALLLVVLDSPSIQLIFMSAATLLVSPRQLALYLLIVRPYTDIKDSVLQIGSMLIVTGFCFFLALFELEMLGDDRTTVSEGYVWSMTGVVVLHIIAALAQVASSAKDIYMSEGQPVHIGVV